MKQDFIKYLKEYSIFAIFCVSLLIIIASIAFLLCSFLLIITNTELIKGVIGFFVSIIILILNFSIFKVTGNYSDRRK